MIEQPKNGISSLINVKSLKEKVRRDIIACRKTGEPFSHSLLTGSPGLGKTSFAKAVCYDLNYYFYAVEGAMIKTRKHIVQHLTIASRTALSYGKKLMFFIDEVHRLGQEPQEALYIPMTEWIIKDTRTKIAPFAIFAATTHPHLLLRPFRSRFVNVWNFEPYSLEDSKLIVALHLGKFKLDYDVEVVEIIAKRCLGIPRRAYNLVRNIRSEVLARGGEKKVFIRDCENTFRIEGIDPIGLDRSQIQYLKVLYEANENPRGLGSIAGILNMEQEVVESDIEPVLLWLGLIDRTPKGRTLTEKGYEHLSRTKQIKA